MAALGALAMFGHHRASLLRRELQGSYDLQRELDVNERSVFALTSNDAAG